MDKNDAIVLSDESFSGASQLKVAFPDKSLRMLWCNQELRSDLAVLYHGTLYTVHSHEDGIVYLKPFASEE